MTNMEAAQEASVRWLYQKAKVIPEYTPIGIRVAHTNLPGCHG